MNDLPPELEPWVEAMAETMYDNRVSISRDHCIDLATATVQALTVPSRTPCPTCEEVGLVATDGPAGVPHTVQCPACEGEGYVTTPSLWDQAVEAACEARYEQVGWHAGERFVRYAAQTEMSTGWEPVFRRRSQHSEQEEQG